MARDPIEALLKVRKLAVDAAQQDFAACLRTEGEANRRERVARDAIASESATATRLDADDAAVEAFAAWLPVGRTALAEAEADAERARADTARARAALSVARSAMQAVEELLAERAAQRAAERERRAQAELDDLPRRVRL